MRSLQQEFQVQFRYAVHFTTDLFAPKNGLLREVLQGGDMEPSGKLLFILDEGVARHCPTLPAEIDEYCRRHEISSVGRLLLVPGGETVKNRHEWVLAIHQAIEAGGICRHSYVVVIGGGAVLDMAGLAAATAHRGVRLIRVPTTVLSQNDSGVGVKNGINAFGKKNFIGTFAPPYAVINDFRFLEMLSDRDWRGGMAEAVKVALIRDAEFFRYLEAHAGALVRREPEPMRHLVYRCAELHLRHIGTGGDPFELGSSRPLDFGHWAAHKLEQLTDHRLRHGEAVAIGVALDVIYSCLSGYLDQSDGERVLNLLWTLGFALYVPELEAHADQPEHPRSILRGLTEFREHLGGDLTVTLLSSIGCGFDVHALDAAKVLQGIALLRERNGERPAPWEGAEPEPAAPEAETHCRLHREKGNAYGTACWNLPTDAAGDAGRVLS